MNKIISFKTTNKHFRLDYINILKAYNKAFDKDTINNNYYNGDYINVDIKLGQIFSTKNKLKNGTREIFNIDLSENNYSLNKSFLDGFFETIKSEKLPPTRHNFYIILKTFDNGKIKKSINYINRYFKTNFKYFKPEDEIVKNNILLNFKDQSLSYHADSSRTLNEIFNKDSSKYKIIEIYRVFDSIKHVSKYLEEELKSINTDLNPQKLNNFDGMAIIDIEQWLNRFNNKKSKSKIMENNYKLTKGFMFKNPYSQNNTFKNSITYKTKTIKINDIERDITLCILNEGEALKAGYSVRNSIDKNNIELGKQIALGRAKSEKTNLLNMTLGKGFDKKYIYYSILDNLFLQIERGIIKIKGIKEFKNCVSDNLEGLDMSCTNEFTKRILTPICPSYNITDIR